MNVIQKTAYSYLCDDPENTEIMVMSEESDDSSWWDIYYRRPGYSYEYAYGLMKATTSLDEAIKNAISNIKNYDYVFN